MKRILTIAMLLSMLTGCMRGNQRYVFNIMGNSHRIVVVIKFTIYFVYIRFIGTHQEYDKMNKTIGAKNI